MEATTKTHEIIHHHKSFGQIGDGTSHYLFEPPEGFNVPCGSFANPKTDPPEVAALTDYFGIHFEPENDELIEIRIVDDLVHKPTLDDLKV